MKRHVHHSILIACVALHGLLGEAGGITQYAYDANDNEIEVIDPLGRKTTRSFDQYGIHHQDQNDATLAKFDYTLNLNGQRVSVTEEINTGTDSVGRTIAWSYDDAGKLTQEQITQTQPTAQNLTIVYSHDKVGNRTARTITGDISQSTTYTYDENDRLKTEVDSQLGTTTYSYDLKGNLTQKQNASNNTSTTYSWNSDNRLIQVKHKTGATTTKTVTYGYDPQGRRIKKLTTEGADKTETHYVLDTERAYHEVVIERTRRNSDPWQERTYLHTPDGIGELISDSDGTNTRQVYTDGQGSTRLTIEGTTSQSWSYEAFGNLLEGSSTRATHGYTGERYDPDTGLIYLRARDYDPRIGRFISMDEHPGAQRIPLTLNKYLYTNADPVNHIDPSGYFFTIASVSIAMPVNFRLRLADGAKGMAIAAAVTCTAAALSSMVSPGTLGPPFDKCEAHRMRIQLQYSPAKGGGVTLGTDGGHVLIGFPKTGVTTGQLHRKLLYMYSDLPSWWPGALDFLGMSEMVYAKSKTFVPHGTPPQFRRSIISVNTTRTKYQY